MIPSPTQDEPVGYAAIAIAAVALLVHVLHLDDATGLLVQGLAIAIASVWARSHTFPGA